MHLFFHDREQSGVCAFQGIPFQKSWLGWFLIEINKCFHQTLETKSAYTQIVFMLREEKNHWDYLKFCCCCQGGGKRAAWSKETSFFKYCISGAGPGQGDSFLQTLNILPPPYGLPDVPQLLLTGSGHCEATVPAVVAALRGLAGSSLQDSNMVLMRPGPPAWSRCEPVTFAQRKALFFSLSLYLAPAVQSPNMSERDSWVSGCWWMETFISLQENKSIKTYCTQGYSNILIGVGQWVVINRRQALPIQIWKYLLWTQTQRCTVSIPMLSMRKIRNFTKFIPIKCLRWPTPLHVAEQGTHKSLPSKYLMLLGSRNEITIQKTITQEA